MYRVLCFACCCLIVVGGGACSTPASEAAIPFTGAAAASQTVDTSFDSRVARATLIFVGTVEARGATTTRHVPVSERIAIVRVDSTLYGRGSLRILRDRRITLRAASDLGPQPGARFLFLAVGLVSDSSLAVQELTRFAVTGDTTVLAITARIDSSRAVTALRRFQAHYNAADAVITGIVRSVEPIAMPDSIARLYLGERSPLWLQATIAVTGIYKNDSLRVSEPATAYVPGSRHISYLGVPALRLGLSGLFMLHRSTTLGPRARVGLDTSRTFAILDSLDLRPLRDSLYVPK